MRETVAAVRGRLAERVARLIDFRIDLAVGHRLAEHERRFAEERAHHDRRIDEHERRLAEVERVHGWTANELERVIPQVAALEARLAELDDLIAAGPAWRDTEAAPARSLIDEIRREHARIRVRLTGVAQYEERLGRLEERLA
ncbi:MULTISPECIES: hypothetical protein [Actinokineospora]|uniref:Uncharacterized protein n=1 Tax=Actinokineospora fastidiosa TaxID=1816 RepID=A0A918L8A1_9PSEU|nr:MULTISPECIES: hypothetical protein [Actinokineospora]UVS76484.1 hypothetical protein Actkin_00171 [Actinokineospora sp. UTMC 2448]GGS17803.1 hypothetical protein GCM10010171_07890 [Actinokineospora fastidiosa]